MVRAGRLRNLAILAGLASMFLGLGACAPKAKPGDPLPGLSRQERERFDRGKEVFERSFTPETGLGPLFNSDRCSECHEDPAVGGRGDEVEVHATARRRDGSCDALETFGGPVFQQHATPALTKALGIDAEAIPAQATDRAMRTTPDILGFGLLDTVPDAEIMGRADPDDKNGDGISGRPNRFSDGRIGRFGRKAFVPTLREFNAGAFLNEQGITSPGLLDEGTIAGEPIPPGVDAVAEPEITQGDLDRADDFVRLLAPPAPLRLSLAAWRGRRLFTRIGCAGCHVPILQTGDSPIRALRYRPVAAYTDLLLHDMGSDLADICLGLATPTEFRTEPLMGLHFSESFLHDGRAKSIEEAVRLHGGEGSRSRDVFGALSDRDRRLVLEFLNRL